MAGRQPEGILQKQVISFLNSHGFWVWGNKNGATYDPKRKVYRRNTTIKGISDILGMIPFAGGRFLAIECKMPRRYPTPEQKRFLEQVNDSGGIGIVVRSLDDAKQLLADFLPSPSA